MRKRIVSGATGRPAADASRWLDLEQQAEVEVTSEDATAPIESALTGRGESGWRAADPGPQTVRLRFDQPRRLQRIHLVFEEHEAPRTQEFVLRWSADGGRTYREIVRQQYNFSPPTASREVEDYAVELNGVTALELHVVPDISGGESRASLSAWMVA